MYRYLICLFLIVSSPLFGSDSANVSKELSKCLFCKRDLDSSSHDPAYCLRMENLKVLFMNGRSVGGATATDAQIRKYMDKTVHDAVKRIYDEFEEK